MSSYYNKSVEVECHLPEGSQRNVKLELKIPAEDIEGRLCFDVDQLKRMLRSVLGQRFSSILFYPLNYRENPFALESVELKDRSLDITLVSGERHMVDVEVPIEAEVVFIKSSDTMMMVATEEQKFKISYRIGGKGPVEESLLKELELKGATREDSVRDIIESPVFARFFFSEMSAEFGNHFRVETHCLHALEISLIYSQIIVMISPR